MRRCRETSSKGNIRFVQVCKKLSPKLLRFRETSPYQTNEFNEGGHRLFPIRRQSDQKPLSPKDYVAIIGDVLRMKKNICLCRHFDRMDKLLVHRSNHIKYIDVSWLSLSAIHYLPMKNIFQVWPINVFDPKNDNLFDVVSMFMMQLGCIINMLPSWKRLHMRVFLCESDDNDSSR